MKCVDCPNYLPDRDEPGCRNDGDVINAWQDIYCGEVDGEEKEWAVRRKIQVAASGGANVDEPKMAVNTELRKDTNPKDNAGSHKWRQYATLPITVLWEVGVAMLEGSLKYGRHNYRAFGARASVYYDAAKGHIDQWWEGEDIDPDSGLHHLSKAIASLVVLRDSQMFGRCVDDRPPSSDVSKVRANLQAVVDVLFGRYPETAKAWSKDDDLPQWFDAKECKLGSGVIGENGRVVVYGQPGNGKATLHKAVSCKPVSKEDAVNLCNMVLDDIKARLHSVEDFG